MSQIRMTLKAMSTTKQTGIFFRFCFTFLVDENIVLPPPAKKTKLEIMLDKLGHRSEDFSEIDQYEYIPPIEAGKDPLEWWKTHEKQFPTLSKVAKKLLCIPATSVPCERVFSDAGNVVTTKRAQLNEDTVEEVLFLYENADCLMVN